MQIKSIRGFNDILPDKIKRWHHIENTAKGILELYGFSEIRTPVIEFTEIFARSLGTTTDIVEKEMYTFTDRDGSSLTLRPEGTAGVVRAYIEHALYSISPIWKLYYMGMMFRHERPQKGRYRGFYQIGAELFGSKDPFSDAEVITMLWRFFEAIGVSNYLTLEISSIGDERCRPLYRSKLIEFFSSRKDMLCKDCLRRLQQNPIRILDCKQEGCKQLTQYAPSILDNLCKECSEHFESVQKNLQNIGINFSINPRIVRGLDYYTRTVFEVTTKELGAQNAVGAGGRYDKLVEELGGPPTPAIGFAIGMERVVLLHEKAFPEDFKKRVDVFIAYLGSEAKKKAFFIADQLRRNSIATELDYEDRSLKSQLKRANKIGARFTIIIGEDELKQDKVKLRNMKESTEEEIRFGDILPRLKNTCSHLINTTSDFHRNQKAL